MEHFKEFLEEIYTLELKNVLKNGKEYSSISHYNTHESRNKLARKQVLAVVDILSLNDALYMMNFCKSIAHDINYLLAGEEKVIWDKLIENVEIVDQELVINGTDKTLIEFIEERQISSKSMLVAYLIGWAQMFFHVEGVDSLGEIEDIKTFYKTLWFRAVVCSGDIHRILLTLTQVTNQAPDIILTYQDRLKRIKEIKDSYFNTPKISIINSNLTKTQIKALYEALKNGQYIDTTLEHFQELFDNEVTKMVTPIQWTKSNRLLVYLLAKICTDEWQSYFENKQAFINKTSKPLKGTDYSSALSDTNNFGSPRGSDRIDKILDTIRKQNA